jgi:hypothetical protein
MTYELALITSITLIETNTLNYHSSAEEKETYHLDVGRLLECFNIIIPFPCNYYGS